MISSKSPSALGRGMISVQLGVGVELALARLRAHALATGRPLPEVAVEVVARRLRLSRHPGRVRRGAGTADAAAGMR